MERLQYLVRASVGDILRPNEVQDLVHSGVLNEYSDIYKLQDLANEILAHKCSRRCLRRIGDGEGPENFKCRKPNNLKISPDNTQHCYIPIERKLSPDCIQKLIKIGMAEPIECNDKGYPSPFISNHKCFHPTRHIPPTNPNDDRNISPVEGKTFSACRSMQNIQCLCQTNGCNRYVCKYCAMVDANNHIIIRANPHDPGMLMSQSTFLHNTKISTSAINEMKAFQRTAKTGKID